jgi:nucleoside-diphosphate-sugar epimerase
LGLLSSLFLSHVRRVGGSPRTCPCSHLTSTASKEDGEEIAAFYYRRHGIRTIAYRLGMFVPESFVGYGFRLLKGGVDDRDS